jgi:uncharacterized protein
MPNRLAAITGASSGIGEAYARALAAEGWDLVLIARRQQRLESLAQELRERHSVGVEVLVADLARQGDTERVAYRLGGMETLELLVNNAGFGLPGAFWELSPEGHRSMLDVHVLATVRLTRAAVPGMLARGRGAVVNVASIAAFFAVGSTAYHASKAYLVAFSRGLSYELAGSGVRVQALCPGFTYTGFHDSDVYQGDERERTPRWMWMEAGPVVEESLRALGRNRVVCVPGLRNRLLLAAGRIPGVLAIVRRGYRKSRTPNPPFGGAA